MKRYIIFLSFFFGFFHAEGQTKTHTLSDTYIDEEISAMKVIRLGESVRFVPIKATKIFEKLKFGILNLGNADLKSLQIDAWYMCSYKHEESFEIYKMFYKPVTPEFFDKNCMSLVALMLLDGTLKVPNN